MGFLLGGSKHFTGVLRQLQNLHMEHTNLHLLVSAGLQVVKGIYLFLQKRLFHVVSI